jgi:hypothetical protein
MTRALVVHGIQINLRLRVQLRSRALCSVGAGHQGASGFDVSDQEPRVCTLISQ